MVEEIDSNIYFSDSLEFNKSQNGFGESMINLLQGFSDFFSILYTSSNGNMYRK